MRYLFCIDSSFESEHAFHSALHSLKENVTKQQCDILLLMSIEDVRLQQMVEVVTIGTTFHPEKEESQDHLREEARVHLLKAEEYTKGLGFQNISMIVGISHNAGELICQVAKDQSIDFIFVGRRSLGTVKRMVLGSVSSYVFENAPCAVIIMKDGEREAERNCLTNSGNVQLDIQPTPENCVAVQEVRLRSTQ